MLKFLLFFVLLAVCVGRDKTKPRHFEVFGDCDIKQCVGNEKNIHTLHSNERKHSNGHFSKGKNESATNYSQF